jgi:hypothetical protein
MSEHQQQKDHASRVATAILQIVFRHLAQRDLRDEIAAILRDEVADAERQVLADTRLSEP